MRFSIPIRRPQLLPLLLLCSFAFTPSSANSQLPSVSIGTITHYPNAAFAQNQFTSANQFLELLESEISRSFSYQKDIHYIGNTNTVQIFRDHNIAVESEFYTSPATLSGLQSQMDFLVLIEPIGPVQARLRLIDMATGYARATETCTRTAGNSGYNGHAPANPYNNGNREFESSFACIRPFLEVTIASARRRASEKSSGLPLNPSATASPYKDIPAPEQSALSLLDIPPNPDIHPTDDQKQKITELTTQFRQTLSLLDKQNKHWEKLGSELAAKGLSLRPDAKQELYIANNEAQRCSQLKANYDVDGLTDCLSKLNTHISKLSSM